MRPSGDDATVAMGELAARRTRIVAHCESMIRSGLTARAAEEATAGEWGVSRGSVRRWRLAAARHRDDAPDTCTEGDGRGRPGDVWSAAGAEECWRLWRADYMRLEAPASAACWRRAEKVAVRNGWLIPLEIEFRRRRDREIPRAEQVRARQGRIAAAALYPHQTRTVAGLRPLDWVSGDGNIHPVFVFLADGRLARPAVWYWQDVWSRRVLAWQAGETENSDLVRLALCDLVDNHGVPRGVVVDNTRAASARWLTTRRRRGRAASSPDAFLGVFEAIGIQSVIRTSVERTAGGRGRGRGQSKPVERAFRDLIEGIDKDPRCAGAYAGANPTAKPENYGQRAVPWDVWLDVVRDGVAEYNSRPGRRTEAAAGRSFDATWAERIGAVPIRRLTTSQRATLLLPGETTTVENNGVVRIKAGRAVGLPANRYWHASLVGYAGQSLTVRYDPRALHAGIEVFGPDGRWLCKADCIAPTAFADTAAAREHARARAGWMRDLDRAVRKRERYEDLLDQFGGQAARTATPPPPEQPAKITEMVPNPPGGRPAIDEGTGEILNLESVRREERRARMLGGMRRISGTT